jgi:hypothetical protein
MPSLLSGYKGGSCEGMWYDEISTVSEYKGNYAMDDRILAIFRDCHGENRICALFQEYNTQLQFPPS